MSTKSDNVVIATVCRRLAPFVQLFGLYVIMHGHSSPGGGFQGGAILAASFIMLAVAEGPATIGRRFSWSALTGCTSAGVLIYASLGVLCLALGANYLDYAVLPFAEPRSVGMLIIEIGVGITVMSALVSIFRDLLQY